MILLYWENWGNREKKPVFRVFPRFSLLGENWHKGQKGRFSACFRVLTDSLRVSLLASVHRKAKVSAFLFCQALRRAIAGGLLLTAFGFCQAFTHAHAHAEGVPIYLKF